MSDDPYTLERLQEFLRQAPVAGLLNPAVAKSRSHALEQLQIEPTPSERADIRLIDVDDVCGRLYKIGDSSVRPEVVDLYNKRFEATLIGVQGTDRLVFTNGLDRARAAPAVLRALENTALATSDWAAGLVSIPLRAGKSVFVQNLPLDLTEQEARKIAGVIEALAVDRSALR